MTQESEVKFKDLSTPLKLLIVIYGIAASITFFGFACGFLLYMAGAGQ
jgi:hypothetical protein